MHHSHTSTVLTFPTSTFSFIWKWFCLKMVWLQECLITFCHYTEDQDKRSPCSGRYALCVNVNAFLSWTTHLWDSRTMWGFALPLEWLRLWWTSVSYNSFLNKTPRSPDKVLPLSILKNANWRVQCPVVYFSGTTCRHFQQVLLMEASLPIIASFPSCGFETACLFTIEDSRAELSVLYT